MRCYGQIIYESGSYAVPYPDDYETWGSVETAKQSLASCWGDIDVDVKNEQGVTLALWHGVPDPDDKYPCDISSHYPDAMYELGRQGGVRRVG